RPAPPTGLALAAMGAALLLRDTRRRALARPSEWLLAAAAFAGYGALLGHVFGAGDLYRLASAPAIGVAVSTAVGLVFASVGLLLERPDAGMMGIATSAGPGGVLLRRLVPAISVGPVVVGVVVTQLFERLGVADDP